MSEATGKTYGFGRVSSKTRPSPYSPVHLPSVVPELPPADSAMPEAVPPRRRRRVAAMLTAAAVVAASVLAVAGLLRAAPPTSARGSVALQDPALAAADDSAERLGRESVHASNRTAHP